MWVYWCYNYSCWGVLYCGSFFQHRAKNPDIWGTCLQRRMEAACLWLIRQVLFSETGRRTKTRSQKSPCILSNADWHGKTKAVTLSSGEIMLLFCFLSIFADKTDQCLLTLGLHQGLTNHDSIRLYATCRPCSPPLSVLESLISLEFFFFLMIHTGACQMFVSPLLLV